MKSKAAPHRDVCRRSIAARSGDEVVLFWSTKLHPSDGRPRTLSGSEHQIDAFVMVAEQAVVTIPRLSGRLGTFLQLGLKSFRRVRSAPKEEMGDAESPSLVYHSPN